jgi:hypothetical protein
LVSRLLDRDGTGACAFAFGKRQLENPVLELRDDAVAVDLVGEREAARRTAMRALLENDAAATLLFLVLLDLGADRDEVAVDADADVFLLGARDRRAYLVVLVVLGDVEGNLAGGCIVHGERSPEALKQRRKQVFDAIDAGEGVHGCSLM